MALYRIEDNKRAALWKNLLIYTGIFLVLAFLVYFLFIASGRTLLRFYFDNRDAFSQRYMFIHGFKRFLDGLFSGGTLNTWDWSIGLGADGYSFYTSMLYSPFSYILYATPDKYVDIVYSGIIVLSVYLSGVSFLICARKFGLTDTQVLLGTVAYSFCPWIIATSTSQGAFVAATILFPLLILGEEKLIRGESPALFILMVGYSVLRMFSFAYMFAIIVLLYYPVRLISKDIKRTAAGHFKNALLFILSGIVGITLSGIGLMCTLMRFGGSTSATGIPVETLWSIQDYLRIPLKLISWSSVFQTNSFIGIAVIGLIMIPLIAWKAVKRDAPSIMTVILFLFVLIPWVNRLFNFMSYPTGRWMFALAFFFSLSAASCFDEELLKNKKAKIAVTIVFALYSGYLVWIHKILSLYERYALGVSWLACLATVIAIWIHYRSRDEKISAGRRAAFGFIVILLMSGTIAANYNVRFHGEYKGYLKLGQAEEIMETSKQKAVRSIDDNGFFRVDQVTKNDIHNRNNEAIYFGNRSTYGFYSSLDYGWIEYNKYLGNNQSYYKRVRMRGNDNRFGLDLLQGVKYYLGDDGVLDKGTDDFAGYGYEPFDVIEGVKVMKNQHFIGLGAVFKDAIRESEWMKLSYADREIALLRAAVIPDEDELPSGVTELKAEDIRTGVKEVKYKAKHKNGKMTISAPNDDEHQLLLSFENVKVEGNELFSLVVNNGKIKKSMTNSRGDERGFPDMKDLSVSLGSGKDAGKKIKVRLKTNGEAKDFSYDALKIYSIPLKDYEEGARELEKNAFVPGEFRGDYVSGTVDSDGGILYLSIIDNNGWEAFVDGEKVKKRENVDIAFSGVDLTPGKHKVELKYHTRGMMPGAVVTLIGIVLMIVLCRIKGLRVPMEESK